MVKSFFWCIFLALFATNFLSWMIEISNETDKQNITYNVGKIVSLGQCDNNNKCSFGYLDKNKNLKYTTSDKPVSMGQLVYQKCWYETKRGDRCYVDYEVSKN